MCRAWRGASTSAKTGRAQHRRKANQGLRSALRRLKAVGGPRAMGCCERRGTLLRDCPPGRPCRPSSLISLRKAPHHSHLERTLVADASQWEAVASGALSLAQPSNGAEAESAASGDIRGARRTTVGTTRRNQQSNSAPDRPQKSPGVTRALHLHRPPVGEREVHFQWNCSSSVEPVRAFTEDEPPWITVVTSSK